FLGLSALLLLNPVSCIAAGTASTEPLTQKASNFFQQGNVEEAAVAEEKAVAENPKDWLAHASLSFYSWHQGNVVKAVEEGQLAVELAPHNYVAIADLALIKEGLDDNAAAIPLYT